MDRIIGDPMDKIMCKDCSRTSYYSYYGFCSISCCADFAHKHNLSVGEATDDVRGERIEELENGISDLECDRDYYEEMAYERSDCANMYEDAIKNIELLKEFKHADAALKVHKELEEVKSDMWKKSERIRELEGEKEEEADMLETKIRNLEEICQRLRAENKVLNSKFTRYEIIDLF